MGQIQLESLLDIATKKEATDIHLVTGRPPIFRIHGDLVPADIKSLTQNEVEEMVFHMLTEEQKQKFFKEREIDFSYFGFKKLRFRVNAHFEKGNVAATFRIIPIHIKTADELGLPDGMNHMINKRKGLIIISGTAGSGKSTTLSCIVDILNNTRKCKIVTIEDPIEYVHESKESLIIQREVGSDTESFTNALKYALRQDPDVVVVGEMRDLDSIAMALTTAETGHLVLSTLHSPDAVETINRIIDVYPSGTREQICYQLAENLLGIIAQTLIPRKDGSGRILATEVLVASIAIRNMIRRGALVEIRGQLDADVGSNVGTHTLENCLAQLIVDGVISKETAYNYARFSHTLKFHLERLDSQSGVKKVDLRAASKQEKEDKKKKIKILVLDDYANDCDGMKYIFKQSNFENIHFLSKAKEGIKWATDNSPDFVIIDTDIHDMDAFEACSQIKSCGISTRVIMITGNLQPMDSVDAKNAGADEFVIKTVAYELLMRAIEKFIL